MDIVTGALNAVLSKLGDLLTGEFQLQANIRDDIVFLTEELECMHAALKIYEAPIDKPPDDQDKLWARDVRELSYEVDDCIDRFKVRVDTNEPKRELSGLRDFINRGINLFEKAKICHVIGTDFNGLKRRIKEANERRVRYKVNHEAANTARPTVDHLRLSALYTKASELVGTEERSENLIKMLMEGYEASEQQQLKIVSIVGFGGLGKTTLAKIVYEKLKGNFDCAAFVSVSHTPDLTSIFKNLLRQLGNHNCQTTWGDDAQLIDELREFLGKRRFFIVIDDVWDDSVWKRIHYAFNNNECASIIVKTTRNLKLAKQANCVYELKPLSLADSKKLFYLRVYGSDKKCQSKELPKVSENILQKCGGVPLAIITIASVLYHNKGNEEYWSKVYKSMGSGMQDNREGDHFVENMRRILSLSYDHLPRHLRNCLLFLSSYPEDTHIEIEELIWKWVGEGFVEKEQGKALYEVGEEYVNELINRSLIQPEYRFGDKEKAGCCRVHDMVLDLITWLSNEEHFLTKKLGPENKIWRLSIQSNNDEVKLLPDMSLSHVRSLTVFGGALSVLSVRSAFPVLRVLDLTAYLIERGNHHFKDICSLFHLRYLRLYVKSITEVPQEIGNLKFLQILDLRGTEIVELPASFFQLRQLVRLGITCKVGISEGFKNLKSLQDLRSYIKLKSPKMLTVLGELTQLRSLRLDFDAWDESYQKAFRQFISSMVSLKHLWIHGTAKIDLESESDTDMQQTGRQLLLEIVIWNTIPSVPRWMTSLGSLSIVRITLQTLREEDLRRLGIIQSLYDLTITVDEPTQGRDKKLIISNDYPFSGLTKLKIRCDVMEVMFAPGAMQNLQKIELEFKVHKTTGQFGDVDFHLEDLSSLQHVFIKMFGSNANPKEVEAAEAAVRQTVDKNPNNPTLKLDKVYVLKLEIHFYEDRAKAVRILHEIYGKKFFSSRLLE
ncbi:hypothetical protein EJB05_27222, partial [Eragrostis curvula]